MSSDLKDARWQMAEEMAAEDGADFYSMADDTKEIYLTVARRRLAVASLDSIAELAAKFRKEVDDG